MEITLPRDSMGWKVNLRLGGTAMNDKGLCFRCEHRAHFHETGYGPRYECKQNGAVGACYMYRPVSPCVCKPLHPDDPRPIWGPAALSCRMQFVRVLDVDGGEFLYKVVPTEGGSTVLIVQEKAHVKRCGKKA